MITYYYKHNKQSNWSHKFITYKKIIIIILHAHHQILLITSTINLASYFPLLEDRGQVYKIALKHTLHLGRCV